MIFERTGERMGGMTYVRAVLVLRDREVDMALAALPTAAARNNFLRMIDSQDANDYGV